MQQVGAQHFATAQAVDPRQLPVPVHLSRQALISLGHVWVLHRRLVVRIAGAVLALLVIVGLYQARDALTALGSTVVSMVQGEFVAAGFGITQIEISGQKLASDVDIATLMALSAGGPYWFEYRYPKAAGMVALTLTLRRSGAVAGFGYVSPTS